MTQTLIIVETKSAGKWVFHPEQGAKALFFASEEGGILYYKQIKEA